MRAPHDPLSEIGATSRIARLLTLAAAPVLAAACEVDFTAPRFDGACAVVWCAGDLAGDSVVVHGKVTETNGARVTSGPVTIELRADSTGAGAPLGTAQSTYLHYEVAAAPAFPCARWIRPEHPDGREGWVDVGCRSQPLDYDFTHGAR